jgi:hypothetical protein
MLDEACGLTEGSNCRISGGSVRGADKQQADMFSYLSPESRVSTKHPLRAIRAMADQALEQMSPLFEAFTPPQVGVDSSREVAARATDSNVVFGSQ